MFYASKDRITLFYIKGQLTVSTMPSWDEYIDNLIAQSIDKNGYSHIHKGCILGIDGGKQWTNGNHANALNLSEDEATNIAKCFKEKAFSEFIESGVVVEGCKYIFIKEEEKTVCAIKRGTGKLTLHSSKTAVVIAYTYIPENGTYILGIPNRVVYNISKHLESVNM